MKNNVNGKKADRPSQNAGRTTPTLDELMRKNESSIKMAGSETETRIASIAEIIKVIGGVLAVVIVIAGFVITTDSSNDMGESPIIISIAVALLIYIPLYFRWAMLKIYINISRNLFVIKDILLDQAETTSTQDAANGTEKPIETKLVEEKKEDDDKIAKLKELRDAGIISQDEFMNQISKL